jgi:hypothetical protein
VERLLCVGEQQEEEQYKVSSYEDCRRNPRITAIGGIAALGVPEPEAQGVRTPSSVSLSVWAVEEPGGASQRGVRHEGVGSSRTIDVHLRCIGATLKKESGHEYIHVIRGVGYCLEIRLGMTFEGYLP